MRNLILIFAVVLLAGCGASASSSAPSPTPGSTLIPTAPVPSGKQFDQAPPMTLNLHHTYRAVVTTNLGTFTILLLPKMAPLAVNSFVFLAHHNFFDNNVFTRVIRDFMTQTGDPLGTGVGGPGYVFRDELPGKNVHYTRGTVAMANSGKDTNGSQFFIVTGYQGMGLQRNYTIFGRVIQGMSTIDRIATTPVTTNPATQELSQPVNKVLMKHVVIVESR